MECTINNTTDTFWLARFSPRLDSLNDKRRQITIHSHIHIETWLLMHDVTGEFSCRWFVFFFWNINWLLLTLDVKAGLSINFLTMENSINFFLLLHRVCWKLMNISRDQWAGFKIVGWRKKKHRQTGFVKYTTWLVPMYSTCVKCRVNIVVRWKVIIWQIKISEK
jgi:hypothetical protein